MSWVALKLKYSFSHIVSKKVLKPLTSISTKQNVAKNKK